MVKQKKNDLKKSDTKIIQKEKMDELCSEKQNERKSNCSTDSDDWRPGDGPHPSD